MATGIDVDALLAPIEGPAPVGTDLRADYSPRSLYFRLRDARSQSRDAERQADTPSEEGNAPPPQWPLVRSLAIEALSGHSKDLEIASWLTEALVRDAGLVGLATGTRVLAALIDRYWEAVFPLPDEDGMETRVAPIGGLSGQGADGTLMQPLRRITVLERPDATFQYWEYEQTVQLDRVNDPLRRQQLLDAGAAFESEARQAGPTTWIALSAQVKEAASAWAALTDTLDNHAEQASPSMSRVRDLLSGMQDLANRFSPAQDVDLPPVQDDEPPAQQAPARRGQPAVSSPGPIGSREQAISQLSDIAAWFKRNEPHSPLAYTLEEAVRRARLTLPELLGELMPDETSRHALLTSLGIRPPSESAQ